jgi:hypothetical protein
LIAIREEMAREADFDVDLFVENVRTGHRSGRRRDHSMAKETSEQKATSSRTKKAGR